MTWFDFYYVLADELPQQAVLREMRSELVRVPVVEVLDHMIQEGIVSPYDGEDINSTPNKIEKMRKLQDLLYTKRNAERGLEVLVQALNASRCNQYKVLAGALTRKLENKLNGY